MGDEFWQVTAQMYISLFEKPKMTEKLLLKPPFKYLFDIVTQTTKSTGFAKGLYSEEELSGDFYDTKEKKIYYLNKIITLTSAMLKEDLEAKPNKIVAGVEPDKTNLFLQAMYRAAVSGEDSTPFVKKILKKFAEEESQFRKEQPPSEENKPEPPRKQKEEKEQKRKEPEPTKKPTTEEAKNPEPDRQKQTRPLSRGGGGQSRVQVVDTRTSSGPSGILRDEPNKKKEEDENFFEEKSSNAGGKLADLNAERHGKMVNEIVKDLKQEEQQDKEEQPQKSGGIKLTKRKPGSTVKTGDKTDVGLSKPSAADSAAGTSQNEVEIIQKLIQNLTQNINPLRKSIDFVSDDIESMNKEMEHWRSQYLNSKGKYQLELANTEEQLQPLQNKLAELEEQIKDKKFKIQAAKSHILQNESKIQKLLHSVVASK